MRWRTMYKLLTPATYQGGKQALAPQIVDFIESYRSLSSNRPFYDLCCGSGAISLEMARRDTMPVSNITMLDNGPWGLLWETVGKGNFDLQQYKRELDLIPGNKSQVQEYIVELAKQNTGSVYHFLILQAASFGGKPIRLGHNNHWVHSGFKSYWQPTETSSRRSHCNPITNPITLYAKMEAICQVMNGVTGVHDDIVNLQPSNSLIYIDPPYASKTSYSQGAMDVLTYVNQLVQRNNICFVSEAHPLSVQYIELSKGTAKGGISGKRRNTHAEYLSIFGA